MANDGELSLDEIGDTMSLLAKSFQKTAVRNNPRYGKNAKTTRISRLKLQKKFNALSVVVLAI